MKAPTADRVGPIPAGDAVLARGIDLDVADEYDVRMKTSAVVVDEATIRLLDKLATSSHRRRSRPALIRAAVREFAAKERLRQVEARERAVIRKHRVRLARQARALVEEQARL